MPRRAVRIVTSLSLLALVVGAGPAGAAARSPRQIYYSGKTSEGLHAFAFVTKKSSGARFVHLGIYVTVECEDGSGEGFEWSVGTHRVPVGEDGSFSEDYQSPPAQPAFAYQSSGTIGFKHAEGTFLFKYASLTEEGEFMWCSSGEIEWTAKRRRSQPGPPLPPPTHMSDRVITFRQDGARLR